LSEFSHWKHVFPIAGTTQPRLRPDVRRGVKRPSKEAEKKFILFTKKSLSKIS
jgi:hypothetical protein